MIMKKFTLLLAAIGMSTMLMAQKPSTETSNFSLEGNINIDATNGVSWTAPSIRMRYFVNDTWAARVQLQIATSSIMMVLIRRHFIFGIGVGAEYHLLVLIECLHTLEQESVLVYQYRNWRCYLRRKFIWFPNRCWYGLLCIRKCLHGT